MKGSPAYENTLYELAPDRHAGYLSLRERDARCDACRMADRCPDAWMGSLDCPDLDHLLKGEGK